MKRIIMLVMMLLTLTGCVKFEVSMDIKKDKSMTLGIIQAIDNSLMEGSENTTTILEEDEKKALEKAGYKVEPYSEDNMTGYKITKEIKNIDEVSTEKEITADLSTSELDDTAYIFTVKKGIFKNTYKAVLKSSDMDEVEGALDDPSIFEPTDDDNEDEIIFDDSEDEIIFDDSEDEIIFGDSEDETEEDDFGDIDYSSLASSFDMTFKVNLPHKALSSNATTTENDGKTLEWDFMELEDQPIKFEFELYNTTNIIIACSAIILVIVVIIILILKNKKKTPKNNMPSSELLANTSMVNEIANSTNMIQQQTNMQNDNFANTQTTNYEATLSTTESIQPNNIFNNNTIQNQTLQANTIAPVAPNNMEQQTSALNTTNNNSINPIPEVPLIQPNNPITNLDSNNFSNQTLQTTPQQAAIPTSNVPQNDIFFQNLNGIIQQSNNGIQQNNSNNNIFPNNN